jgi:hypothetical protein
MGVAWVFKQNFYRKVQKHKLKWSYWYYLVFGA